MRPDLLQRVQLVCPACTWKRNAPAAVRLENAAERDGDVHTGVLRCVQCSEGYPIIHGVAVLSSQAHRRVSQETHQVEDPLRLLGPHLLAHFGDLLPEPARGNLSRGDFWPTLADLPAAGGLAVDLSASAGRAVLGLSRTASFVLGCEGSFITARLARESFAHRRARIRVVEEGAFTDFHDVDLTSAGAGEYEVVVADPDAPPVPPGRAALVLAANLLERQGDPEGFVRRSASLVARAGRLALASPYTWWEEHAPRDRWIGKGERPTRDALVDLLGECGLAVESEADLLLVLREQARLEQIVRPHLIVARR